MRDLKVTPDSKDWAPLFSAFADALEWVLDRAGDFARAYPQEVATIERVRGFVRKRIAGEPAHVRVDDLLFTIGLVAGALERDRAVAAATAVAAARIDAPARSNLVPMSLPPLAQPADATRPVRPRMPMLAGLRKRPLPKLRARDRQ